MAFMDDVLGARISSIEKGMPPGEAICLADVGSQGWSILAEDTSFPIALIRDTALSNNASWMQRFAEQHGLWLYPHGKTTMAPQIFRLQVEHGCRGITAANTTHLDVYLRSGIESVFLANQVTGKQSLKRLALLCDEHPSAEIFLIVDSEANVRDISRLMGPQFARGQLKVLVEFGAVGGRTGVRTAEEAIALAKLMKDLNIPAAGLEAFEGIFNMRDPARAEESVRRLLGEMQGVYKRLQAQGLLAEGVGYLSAGGSWFYDLVAQYFSDMQLAESPRVILRSGCTITHDSGLCKRAYESMLERGLLSEGDHLKPALEVWAQVQSQPEPGLAFANAGKRDLSHDVDLPVPILWYRPGKHSAPEALTGQVQVTGLNDQHAYLRFEEGIQLQVGDLLGFGISHPCTTFDKWKYLFSVDDSYSITGAIKTFF